MESDAANGMQRRFAAVRLGTIRHHPCTVQFMEGVPSANNEDDAGVAGLAGVEAGSTLAAQSCNSAATATA